MKASCVVGLLYSSLWATFAWAGDAPVLSLVPDAELSVDGFFEDWNGRTVLDVLDQKPGDIEVDVQMAASSTDLYVAVQAKDDQLVFGTVSKGDRLQMTLGTGSGAKKIQFVLSDLEQNPGRALLNGKPYKNAEFSGTSRVDGWAFEARLPFESLPNLMEAGELPFSFELWDSDKGQPETHLTTKPGMRLKIDACSGLQQELESALGQPIDVLDRISGQVSGVLPAEVIIGKNLVALLGRGLETGTIYSYFIPGWRDDPQLVEVELVDIDGKGNREIWIIHKEWAIPGEVEIEALEVYGFYDGVLKRQIAQKLAERHVKTGQSVTSKAHRIKAGKGYDVKIDVATVEGFNEGSYADVDRDSDVAYEPMVLPWTNPKGRVFHIDGPRMTFKD